MAITMQLGGIRRHDNIFTTVIPISLLVDLTIPGMAFAPKEVAGESYDHLDERVSELISPIRAAPAAAAISSALPGSSFA